MSATGMTPLPPDGLVAAITSQVKKRATLVCSNPACRAAHSRKGQRYCAACHADYQQAWRVKQKEQAAATRARLDALTAEFATDGAFVSHAGERLPTAGGRSPGREE
jgi:hypothetical protein